MHQEFECNLVMIDSSFGSYLDIITQTDGLLLLTLKARVLAPWSNAQLLGFTSSKLGGCEFTTGTWRMCCYRVPLVIKASHLFYHSKLTSATTSLSDSSE